MNQWINARVFTENGWLDNHTVVEEDGRITAIFPTKAEKELGSFIDCGGAMLVPALIDLQVYGRGGKLFSAFPQPESLALLASENRKTGVGLCLVTIATQPFPVIMESIRGIKAYWKQGGEGIAGLHLEGPFMNVLKRGAHKAEWIIPPTDALVDELLAVGGSVIKMITLAPENCAPHLIQRFADAGIVVSAGHSNAGFELGMKMHEFGVSAVTHLFNAMSPFHHREVGLPGATFQNTHLIASIIPDGIHVSYPALKTAKFLMGDRLYFITDAVTDTFTGPYQHQQGDGCFVLPDGTLSGSAIGLLQGVKNAVDFAGIPLEESLRMASLYPAKLMGLQKEYGSIAPGKKAAMILVNEALELQEIFMPR